MVSMHIDNSIKREMKERVNIITSVNFKGSMMGLGLDLEDINYINMPWVCGSWSIFILTLIGTFIDNGNMNEIMLSLAIMSGGTGLIISLIYLVDYIRAKKSRTYGRKYYARLKSGVEMKEVDSFSDTFCYLEDYDDSTKTITIIVPTAKGYSKKLEKEFSPTKEDLEAEEMIRKVVRF